MKKKPLSRSRKYQLRNRRLGLCEKCSNPRAHGSKNYCETHRDYARVQGRKKNGHRPNPRIEVLGHDFWRNISYDRPDHDIAEDYDVSLHTAKMWRLRMGILHKRGPKPKAAIPSVD